MLQSRASFLNSPTQTTAEHTRLAAQSPHNPFVFPTTGTSPGPKYIRAYLNTAAVPGFLFPFASSGPGESDQPPRVCSDQAGRINSFLDPESLTHRQVYSSLSVRSAEDNSSKEKTGNIILDPFVLLRTGPTCLAKQQPFYPTRDPRLTLAQSSLQIAPLPKHQSLLLFLAVIRSTLSTPTT